MDAGGGIEISKKITAADDEAKAIVAANDSVRELLKKDKLRELAIVLTEKVRENTSIDWTMKESVQAQLRVVIKRTLRKYGTLLIWSNWPRKLL